MRNLESDTMVIMGFHAPLGVEYQLSLLNEKERRVVIQSKFCAITLESHKTGLDWTPVQFVAEVNPSVTNNGCMDVEVAVKFSKMLDFSILVTRFVESHRLWRT
jgi:hypothetical protein